MKYYKDFIDGDSNCLFRTIYFCLFNKQQHCEIHLQVVEKIINQIVLQRLFLVRV